MATKKQRTEDRPISNLNEIQSFFHCSLCLAELPPGKTPREWVHQEAGATPQGIQIWCVRHECNIAHIDFEGQKHPANLTRRMHG